MVHVPGIDMSHSFFIAIFCCHDFHDTRARTHTPNITPSVRLWDPWTSLLLIRVPRKDYPQIRATLTVWTHCGGRRIVASVLGVHGSARTAKRGTLLYLQKWFQKQQQQQKQQLKQQMGDGSTEQEYKRLQNLVSIIQAID